MSTKTQVCQYCGKMGSIHDKCPTCDITGCDIASGEDHGRCEQPDPEPPLQDTTESALKETIERLRAENVELREWWLTEQKARLEQADLLDVYSAVKAKAEIERLREAVEAGEECCESMEVAWRAGEIRRLKASLAEHTEPDMYQTGILKANFAALLGFVVGALLMWLWR